jgi:hypothetical protein
MSSITKVCVTCSQQFDESMMFCLNCGSHLKLKDKIINCDFEYKCPLQWENLPKSDSSNVRFCSSCEKNVYFAHSQNELENLAKAGKCVAFNPTNDKYIFQEVPPLMGMVAPPEPPPLMGLPVSPKKEKEKKISRWKFWK